MTEDQAFNVEGNKQIVLTASVLLFIIILHRTVHDIYIVYTLFTVHVRYT